MLCCKPKKNQYDFDEVEDETEKKNHKSKDKKKNKSKEKITEKVSSENDTTGKDGKEEVKEQSSDAVNKEECGNNDQVLCEGAGGKTVEEKMDKSKAANVETGISSSSDDMGNSEVSKAVNQTKSYQGEAEVCSENDKQLPVKYEDEKVKETIVGINHCSEVESKEQNIVSGTVCKDVNVSSLQEKTVAISVIDQDLTETGLSEKLGTQSEEAEIKEETVMSAEQMQTAISRLEAVAVKLETLAQATVSGIGGAGGQAAPDVVAPFVSAFDEVFSGEFAKYLDLSSKIGGDVQTQAEMVQKGFQSLRGFLIIVSKSKKPSQSDLIELLGPISGQITAVQEYREKNRGSKLFNHLSGISESIPALGWVTVEPTPGPFVKEMSDAGMFYTNRVIKDFKETDQTHVDWTKAWLGTLRELQAYIKQYHTTGVSWNPQGGDAKSAAGAKVPPAPGGAPPPPPPGPPPPPPPPVADVGGSSEGGGQDNARAALFADLNKGDAVTSGLKKVTDDMKTHKNPALRATSQVTGVRAGPAPFKAQTGPPKPAPKPNKAEPVAKPPVFELQMKKWVVEYQKGNKTMVIDDTNIKQTVYMYKCENSTLQIKGKVNSITLDNCKKVAIAFDDVVSSIEFVNCQSIQAQVMGKCPTVSIDKTDGCQMYLSKDSLDAEIVTAKSSEMNILVPKDDGDFEEFPLPEQYKTLWNGKKFVTNVAESV